MLTLTGQNTYTGGTDAQGGTLDAASPDAVPGYNVSGQVPLRPPTAPGRSLIYNVAKGSTLALSGLTGMCSLSRRAGAR